MFRNVSVGNCDRTDFLGRATRYAAEHSKEAGVVIVLLNPCVLGFKIDW